MNAVRSGAATEMQIQSLAKVEADPTKRIDNVVFATNLTVVDYDGNNVTEAVKAAVASGSANSGMQSDAQDARR